MLYAYTEEKDLVDAADSSEKQKFFCPDCGSSLIRKAGKTKIPHFAHTMKTDCHGLSEGETAEHLYLKQLFYDWGNQFGERWRIEQPLTDLPQRPDLLHEQLAVEIQCSPLKSSRLEERIAGYTQKNYQNWWLLGRKLWPKGKFTPLQKQFCSFDKERGLHLWLLERKQIRLFYHIHEAEGFFYREERWACFSEPLKKIFHSPVTKRPLHLFPTIESINRQKQALSLKLNQRNPKIRDIQQYFYHEGSHLLYLPKWMYFPSRYFFFYQEDILLFRYLFQLEEKNATLIFQKFLKYRKENQREWLFYQIEQREILERLYLEAIFLSKKG